MEKYAYLIVGLSLGVWLTVLLLYRKEFAAKATKLGLMGGVACTVLDPAVFRDYWLPPSLSVFGSNYIENFIFGFTVTAVAFILYLVMTGHMLGRRAHPERRIVYFLFIIASVVSLLVFNQYLRVNSVFVTSGIFIVLAGIILLMRKDLAKPAIYSAVLMTGFVVIVYAILLNFIVPDFNAKYWLLADTRWGATILGKVPLTELLWYFSWALFASISYPFISGRVLAKQR